MSGGTVLSVNFVPETEKSVANAPPRRIAHLDMDAFFASVELLRYPQLKGLPVVIGGGRRTVGAAGLPAGSRAYWLRLAVWRSWWGECVGERCENA